MFQGAARIYELVLIQTRIIQKPLLWVGAVGSGSACVAHAKRYDGVWAVVSRKQARCCKALVTLSLYSVCVCGCVCVCVCCL